MQIECTVYLQYTSHKSDPEMLSSASILLPSYQKYLLNYEYIYLETLPSIVISSQTSRIKEIIASP
jgi:hypothetical protein